VIAMPVADEVLNTPLIANARMYSSGAPAAAAAWTSLLNWVVTRAGCGFEVLDYPPPKPLDAFWARADLGCAFMCGLPYARDPRPLTPIIAPVVRGARYAGRPIYFTDIVVRSDSPYRTLEDTFGGRIGYTVHHSQSGYVALREHLLPYRLRIGHSPYRKVVGPLYGARDIVDALLAGRIDVGPLDSYVHDLIGNLQPDIGAQLRTVATTRASPIPLFVATAPIGHDLVGKLQAAFMSAARAEKLKAERDMLLIADFVIPEQAPYQALRARAEAAAVYPDVW
jgi:ABC-type phosphate/phosphonate transport system substrate-binding protein